MTEAIVDTNVPIVANGKLTAASLDCQLECVRRLTKLVRGGRVNLDAGNLIFEQYKRHLSFRGQPGVGNMFFKHVFDHMYDSRRVRLVQVQPLDDDKRGPDYPDVSATSTSFPRRGPQTRGHRREPTPGRDHQPCRKCPPVPSRPRQSARA